MGIHQRTHLCMAKSRAPIVHVCSAGMAALALSFPVDATLFDVLKGTAGAPSPAGNFTDPNLPAGYALFNIESLGGVFYVTCALQDAGKHDDVAGPGFRFVTASSKVRAPASGSG